MIKNEMTLTLAVDTATVKATGAAVYTATDEQLKAYTIGFIPWEMIEKSVLLKGLRRGTLSNNPANMLNYAAVQEFNADRGIPFCYSYAQSGTSGQCNVYYDGEDYVDLPWGVTTDAGIIHAYNTDDIINNSPQLIAQTLSIGAVFKMFVVYLPEGSAGGWSSPNGENGWVTALSDKTADLDPFTLDFSVTSSTDSSYMSTPATFTLADLQNAGENGVMIKENGTTQYGGVTYHIFVHCILSNAYLNDYTAAQLKNGILIYENMRYSGLGGIATPFFSTVANGYSVNDVFTCNAIPDIAIEYGGTNGYYILTSETSYEVFRSGYDLNNLLSGGYTETDLKILRSVARPVYKINNAFYVAEFNDDYTITGELIPYVQARNWQKNINPDENEFNPADIPEPAPEEAAENIGDKITRPASIGIGGTNGFVTQYALDKTDVAQLGALLWTSFVDQDYWQNYLFSLAVDTGSFSLSSLLNFFVSLKVYPFSLVNIRSFASWGNNMYIGTGVVPLHFTNPLHTINNYADYISGGEIDIPRYFNDYRDYINTEIILYLPFCGTVHLNPGDVIGNKIKIQYAIDFATGGCIAYVDLETGDGAGYPVGAMPGQIGADIPLTATAAGEVAARFIGDAMNVGGLISGEVGGIAKGIAGALGGTGAGGSSGGSMFAGIAGMYGGIGAAMGADLAPGFARQGLQMLQRGAVSAPMLSGGRGFASFGAPSKPYVQIRRGIYPTVSGLATVDGKPAAGTYEIGQLTGFVQGSVKTDGLTCPENEKIKIKNLIASGIYV